MTVSIISEDGRYYCYSNTWGQSHIVNIQSFSRFEDALQHSILLLKLAEK